MEQLEERQTEDIAPSGIGWGGCPQLFLPQIRIRYSLVEFPTIIPDHHLLVVWMTGPIELSCFHSTSPLTYV